MKFWRLSTKIYTYQTTPQILNCTGNAALSYATLPIPVDYGSTRLSPYMRFHSVVQNETKDNTDRVHLQRPNSSGLEAKVCLEILRYLTDESLEGQFSDQQFGWFLISANFTKCDRTRAVTMGLFDSTSWWCRFSRSLQQQPLDESLLCIISSSTSHCHVFDAQACHNFTLPMTSVKKVNTASGLHLNVMRQNCFK